MLRPDWINLLNRLGRMVSITPQQAVYTFAPDRTLEIEGPHRIVGVYPGFYGDTRVVYTSLDEALRAATGGLYSGLNICRYFHMEFGCTPQGRLVARLRYYNLDSSSLEHQVPDGDPWLDNLVDLFQSKEMPQERVAMLHDYLQEVDHAPQS